MNTVTLSGGHSYELPLGDFIKINATRVRGEKTDMRLEVRGQLTHNQYSSSDTVITELQGDVTVVLVPAQGAEFPPDHSVIMRVLQPATAKPVTVQTEEIRLDGLNEKTVLTLSPSGESVQISAVDSGISTTSSRSTTTVYSALTTIGAPAAAVRRASVWMDDSASVASALHEVDLSPVHEILKGVSEYFSITVDDHSTPTEQARTTVGADLSSLASEDCVAVLSTHLRPALHVPGRRTLVIVLGPHAREEADMYRNAYGERYPLNVLVIDDALHQALSAGDRADLHDEAEVLVHWLCADELNEPAASDPLGGENRMRMSPINEGGQLW
ncbi:hypothetical protein CCICO_10210 [Corynebacterium ciconiae DSM 44920]|uniref:hypothetical protein n=1 Tax=Corynebacterium ciconiae TaxID=227319 RepID=UPI00035C2413|nr:hypothetical protein [Corynebacterium ciconiae]WKD62041.1 hypothetical protein CCICO_10210 [Corynebacterium ciconiae DSM 44920]